MIQLQSIIILFWYMIRVSNSFILCKISLVLYRIQFHNCSILNLVLIVIAFNQMACRKILRRSFSPKLFKYWSCFWIKMNQKRFSNKLLKRFEVRMSNKHETIINPPTLTFRKDTWQTIELNVVSIQHSSKSNERNDENKTRNNHNEKLKLLWIQCVHAKWIMESKFRFYQLQMFWWALQRSTLS